MHRTNPKLRTLVWGTLLALLVGGLPNSQAQEPAAGRGSALIVPIGGTVRLQMKSKKPIKTVVNPKENVVNIRTVVGDPTTILITGQTPDVTTIELTDIDDRKETYEVIVQLDIEYLKTQLRRAVPTANITPIPSSNNAVILTGTVSHAEDVDIILRVAQSIGGIQVINAMHVGGVQQVQLDVVVASVSRQTTRSIGYDFQVNAKNSFFGSFVSQLASLPGSIGTAGAFSAAPLGGTPGLLGIPAGSSNFLFGVLHSGWNMLGFLEALRTEGLAKFLAQPTLVTLSGRPATFIVGGDQAVPVVGGIGGATGISFEPFGTQLTFLPIVLGNGKIHMEVNPSITDLDPSFGAVIQGNVVPGRRRESVNTTVQLESGQTFVIGGLIRHTTSANSRRTPLLGDLPFIGTFWGTRTAEDLEEEIIILVTPHLVDPQDCNQVIKVLPGQETRNPDDFELFLEGILEAPRGPRSLCQNRRYVPAYKNSPSLEVFPCAGGCGDGHCGVEGAGAAPAMSSPELPQHAGPQPSALAPGVPGGVQAPFGPPGFPVQQAPFAPEGQPVPQVPQAPVGPVGQPVPQIPPATPPLPVSATLPEAVPQAPQALQAAAPGKYESSPEWPLK